MAKKRIVKKSSSNFNIPESFSGLNFNQKIIAVTLIVLVVGIIGSLFPGNVTGMDIADTGVLKNLIKNNMGTVDYILTGIFQVPADKIFIYEKFVLFLLLFAILSAIAGLLRLEGMTKLVIAGAISLISTWFIPPSVLAMIGLSYSSLYATLLILVPVIVMSVIAWQLPKTKFGYWLRTIIFLILVMVFGATRKGVENNYDTLKGTWFSTFSDIISLILVILIVVYIITALSISEYTNAKNFAIWKRRETGGKLWRVMDIKLEKAIERAAGVGAKEETKSGKS